MTVWLRQSTAVDLAIGPFLDSSDGVTVEDGLTISQADVRLKKNNGNWAQVNDNTSATHEEFGWYEKEFDATDTNTVGRLVVAVTEAGALPVWHEFWVLEEAIYDALFAASATGALPVSAGGIASTAFASAAITADAIATDAIGAAEIADGAITAPTFAAGAIDAASLAADAGTEIGTAVWATASRSLTVLDEDSTTLDLDATIRAAVGLGAANLDTQLDALPTAAENADAMWDEDATGHQTGGTFGQAIGDPGANTETLFKAIVVDPAGTNIAADVIAIKAETAAILDDTDDIGVAGAGLTVLATQASVDAIDDILDTEFPALVTAVADLPTNAELATALGTADDAVLAQIALVKAVTDKVDDTLEDDAGTYRFTANALEESPSGGTGLDAAGVRDAIGLATANLDTQLADIESKVDDTEGLITTVDTVVDAILVDTNELQTDWVNGGRLDLLIDAINAKTTNLPTDPADESALEALIDALPTGAENAAALLDLVNGVETGLTPRQALRLFAAALLGKASGLETTTAVYRDTGDSKDRITATVDVDGNRSVVTLDAS